jgi:hypothetical protein
MIGIPVTAAAYEAIKGPLPGQPGSPPLRGCDGLFRIWLDCKVVDELGRLRGPGESYSDVILRLAKASPVASQRGAGTTARPLSALIPRASNSA